MAKHILCQAHKTGVFQSGFTLIELLVVIAVIVVLTGGGLAAYIRFSDRQSAEVLAREIHNTFLSARSKARFKERANCAAAEGVIGFRVNAGVSADGRSGVLRVLSICGNDRVSYANPDPVTHLVESIEYNLSQQTVLPALPFNVDFYSLYGGAKLPGSADEMEITVSHGGATYGFTVDRGGDISPVAKE